MNSGRIALNEPPQFGHSKNKSVITGLPTQNKYISNILSKNIMIKTNKTNRQEMTSCCSKLSTTFGNIFSSDQKRTDAMQLIRNFRNNVYPKKDTNTFVMRRRKEEYNKDTITQSPLNSNLFQESPIISHKEKEEYQEYIEDEEKEKEKALYYRKNRKKHLTQYEIGNYLENSKNNEADNREGKCCYDQRGMITEGYLIKGDDNKKKKKKNNKTFKTDYNALLAFESLYPNRDIEFPTQIIECSPIKKVRDDDDYNEDNRDNKYQQEKKDKFTIKGIKLSTCFTNMSIEQLKDNNSLLFNENNIKKANKTNNKIIINGGSFSIDRVLSTKFFHQTEHENRDQFALISLERTLNKENDLVIKPMLRPMIFSKEVMIKSNQEKNKIQLIQLQYRKHLNKKKIMKENSSLTGIKINFYYKGNAYTQTIIESNRDINQTNRELKELILKGYHDNDSPFLQIINHDKANNFILESNDNFCFKQTYVKPEDNKMLNNKASSNLLIESKESITISSFDTNSKSKEYSHRSLIELIVNQDQNLDKTKANIQATILTAENKTIDQEAIKPKIEDALYKMIPSFDSSNNKETEDSHNDNNETNQKQISPYKFKKMQTEVINTCLIKDALFPKEEDDKIKQYIDDKPISKNKKKPTFANFDEKYTKSKEIEEITTQSENEGRKKANQLRQRMKFAKLISTKGTNEADQ